MADEPKIVCVQYGDLSMSFEEELASGINYEYQQYRWLLEKDAVKWLVTYVESPEGWGSVRLAGIGQLSDGRWVSVEGGADTTGWGCQDYMDVAVQDTRELLISQGVTLEMAQMLHLEEKKQRLIGGRDDQ